MNNVVMVGRLTKDPELRYIPGTGTPCCTFTIAVDRAFVNKEGKKETDFFNVVVYGKPGENCANYTSKGSLVAIKGSIQNRTYETQNGEKRYITEIVADRVEFLSKSGQAQNNIQKDLNPDGFQALDDDDIDGIPF